MALRQVVKIVLVSVSDVCFSSIVILIGTESLRVIGNYAACAIPNKGGYRTGVAVEVMHHASLPQLISVLPRCLAVVEVANIELGSHVTMKDFKGIARSQQAAVKCLCRRSELSTIKAYAKFQIGFQCLNSIQITKSLWKRRPIWFESASARSLSRDLALEVVIEQRVR